MPDKGWLCCQVGFFQAHLLCHWGGKGRGPPAVRSRQGPGLALEGGGRGPKTGTFGAWGHREGGRPPGPCSPVLGWLAPCAGLLSFWRIPGMTAEVPKSRLLRWGPPLPVDPFAEGLALSPAICIQDGLSPLLRLPCHHLSRPPVLLLRAGCQAAAWPAVAVAELDKAPASPPRSPPSAPSGGKAASSPGRSLSGVGVGSRAAPGASWPLPTPPGALHTARIV